MEERTLKQAIKEAAMQGVVASLNITDAGLSLALMGPDGRADTLFAQWGEGGGLTEFVDGFASAYQRREDDPHVQHEGTYL